MENSRSVNDSRVKIAAVWVFILGIIGILESLAFLIVGLMIIVSGGAFFMAFYIPLFILAIIVGFPSLRLLEISRSIKNLEVDGYKRASRALGIFSVIFGIISWVTISFLAGTVEYRGWELFIKAIKFPLIVGLIALLILSHVAVLRMLGSRKEMFTHERTVVYQGSFPIVKIIKLVLILPLLLFLTLLFVGFIIFIAQGLVELVR